MRMKKFLIIAATALLAAACAKTYEVKETTPPAIGFGSWAETLTKARTQGDNTFTEGDNFSVFGSKISGSTPTTVFADVTVTRGSTDVWTYNPTVYWDHNADSYVFYAVSPAGLFDLDPADGNGTSSSITFAGNNNDILVADKKQVEKGSSAPYFNNYATVSLVFNHVASLVDVKVKKATGLHDATVAVTAFSLENIESAGVLTVSNAYTNTHPVATWNSSATDTYGPESGVVKVKVDDSGNYEANGTNTIGESHPILIAEDTAFNPTTPTTPAASTFLINNLIVKPQSFGNTGVSTSQKISISYTLGSDPTVYSRVVYLADFDKTDDADQDDELMDTGFQPGKHYILYLTIDARAISFSAEITPWTDVNGYNYLIN